MRPLRRYEHRASEGSRELRWAGDVLGIDVRVHIRLACRSSTHFEEHRTRSRECGTIQCLISLRRRRRSHRTGRLDTVALDRRDGRDSLGSGIEDRKIEWPGAYRSVDLTAFTWRFWRNVLRTSPRDQGWCHNGTMKRMNPRDVPDEVYSALTEAAEANRQSLSAFVVDRLTEVARVVRLEEYVASYRPPQGSGLTVDDATAAVRQARETS